MTEDFLDRLSAATRCHLDEIAVCHEIGLLETAAHCTPNDFEILSRLRHLYSRAGRGPQSLDILWRLVSLAPTDPVIHYRLACQLALSDQLITALMALTEAIVLGYRDLHSLLNDRDLTALRAHPEFQGLISTLSA